MSLALFVLLATGAGWAAVRAARRATGARRWVGIGAIVVGALPVLMILGALSAYLVNNWRLARFSEQLFTYPLPAGARELARRAEVGLLTGNGDHCDFVVTRELATTLPVEAVRAHYGRLQLRPAIAGGTGGPPWLDVEARAGGVVVVTATDAPYDGGFDLRCT